jgi:hypothetical protein
MHEIQQNAITCLNMLESGFSLYHLRDSPSYWIEASPSPLRMLYSMSLVLDKNTIAMFVRLRLHER